MVLVVSVFVSQEELIGADLYETLRETEEAINTVEVRGREGEGGRGREGEGGREREGEGGREREADPHVFIVKILSYIILVVSPIIHYSTCILWLHHTSGLINNSLLHMYTVVTSY